MFTNQWKNFSKLNVKSKQYLFFVESKVSTNTTEKKLLTIIAKKLQLKNKPFNKGITKS